MAVVNKYYPGNVVRFTATITNSGGDLIDPGDIFAAIKQPDSSVSSIDVSSVVNPSTGVYYFDLSVSSAGEYILRWHSTGDAPSLAYNPIFANTPAF